MQRLAPPTHPFTKPQRSHRRATSLALLVPGALLAGLGTSLALGAVASHDPGHHDLVVSASLGTMLMLGSFCLVAGAPFLIVGFVLLAIDAGGTRGGASA